MNVKSLSIIIDGGNKFSAVVGCGVGILQKTQIVTIKYVNVSLTFILN